MLNSSKQFARNLPCIFENLVTGYKDKGLRECETKKTQKWRHASSQEAANRLSLYHNFFPELASLQTSLETYSLCEKHYNQIVASTHFYQFLLNPNQTVQNYNPNKKRSRRSVDSQLEVHKTFVSTCNIGIQVPNVDIVDIRTHDIGIQVSVNEILNNMIGHSDFLEQLQKIDSEQKTQYILELIIHIQEQQKQLENRRLELAELSQQLSEAYEFVIESHNQYQEQCKRNQILTQQWNSRFSSQEKRIDAIIKIALAERENLFNDINSLINNVDRFSLENLMYYTPQTWLSQRNQVIVKFIETLTQNNNNIYGSRQEKFFKRAVAVDAIYGSRHGKYVSEINLVASAIKYSITRSKMVIDIDKHITSGGCYSQFQKWLDRLSKEQEPLPDGLLFIAFDNEQKGQKNYLDRGFNTVIFHTVTSFVAFNIESQNKIQHTDIPWLNRHLTKLDYEELFDLSPQMQKEIDKELYIYLSEIIDLLCKEKSALTNEIDILMENIISNNGHNKYCSNCNEKNIENRKQTCPKCRFRLPTLIELQKSNLVLETNLLNESIKQPIFKSHSFKKESKTSTTVPRISITQRLTADQDVRIPEIYIPDPLNVNPNSIVNVEKVFQHIEKISGIQDGLRKWMVVVCDGVPYHHAIKIKNKFPWLIIIPGQLHEEMNMLRAYVELNW